MQAPLACLVLAVLALPSVLCGPARAADPGWGQGHYNTNVVSFDPQDGSGTQTGEIDNIIFNRPGTVSTGKYLDYAGVSATFHTAIASDPVPKGSLMTVQVVGSAVVVDSRSGGGPESVRSSVSDGKKKASGYVFAYLTHTFKVSMGAGQHSGANPNGGYDTEYVCPMNITEVTSAPYPGANALYGMSVACAYPEVNTLKIRKGQDYPTMYEGMSGTYTAAYNDAQCSSAQGSWSFSGADPSLYSTSVTADGTLSVTRSTAGLAAAGGPSVLTATYCYIDVDGYECYVDEDIALGDAAPGLTITGSNGEASGCEIGRLYDLTLVPSFNGVALTSGVTWTIDTDGDATIISSGGSCDVSEMYEEDEFATVTAHYTDPAQGPVTQTFVVHVVPDN